MSLHSALRLGYAGCHICELVLRIPRGAARHARLRCPRCGAAVHPRKPDSIRRTWALLIAAYVFYVPAMALPITRITTLGAVQEDTIMSGVIYFFQNGEWPIGAVIFIASVFVPVLKLFILTVLALSVQRRWLRRPRDRTRLYRITEMIGRWSMVDIYVVTLLVALVKVGTLANVEA
jgi:paraquat-inducible protein A